MQGVPASNVLLSRWYNSLSGFFLMQPGSTTLKSLGLVISIGSIHSGGTYRGFDIGGMGLLDVARCGYLRGFMGFPSWILLGLDQLFGSIWIYVEVDEKVTS